MQQSYLISSVFLLLHTVQYLFQEGWIMLSDHQTGLIPCSGNLSMAALPSKRWGAALRILLTLIETSAGTLSYSPMTALFSGIYLPLYYVLPHSFCPIPDLCTFFFPILASLSLQHIITLPCLPDQEEEVIILQLTVTLTLHHMKGVLG